MQDHLRSVPPVDPDGAPDAEHHDGGPEAAGSDEGSPSVRVRVKPRAKKALPTDRLKLDVQKKALGAIAVLSDYGQRSVGAADLAPSLGLSPATAGLNNSFFMESGLIVRESKGKYKPTEAVNEYARRYSFDSDRAGLCLTALLSQTWFFQCVRRHLAGIGPASRDKLIELLAYEAGATKEHAVQLGSLLGWLEYAGLIAYSGDDRVYTLARNAPKDPDEAPGAIDGSEVDGDGDTDPAPKSTTTEKVAEGEKKDRVDAVQPKPVLSFSFDFALTKDDLAALTPEQIEAVYKAVGGVMAIKASLTST